MQKNIAPAVRADKAQAKVNKALAAFTDAANELDLVAEQYLKDEAEFLAAAEAAEKRAADFRQYAVEAFDDRAATIARAAKLRALVSA